MRHLADQTDESILLRLVQQSVPSFSSRPSVSNMIRLVAQWRSPHPSFHPSLETHDRIKASVQRAS